MIELDNTMLLFIGSENYSGRKIPMVKKKSRPRTNNMSELENER